MDADRILVLRHGSVVEEGDYRSLVGNQQSYFYKLWMKQHEADRQLYQDSLKDKE